MHAPYAGYIGSESLLNTIVRLVDLLRQRNPNLTYGARLQYKVLFPKTVWSTHDDNVHTSAEPPHGLASVQTGA